MRQKGYDVEAVIKSGVDIVSAKCTGCVAALGGCKHVIAFLFWLNRRSEEPSPTEVLSYWRKGELSKIGTSIPFDNQLCDKLMNEATLFWIKYIFRNFRQIITLLSNNVNTIIVYN